MRHKTYIGSQQVVIETERAIAHLLVGQLDEEAVRPRALLEKEAQQKLLGRRATDEQKLTIAEIETINRWNNMKSRGAFELKPLDWCESEAQAEEAQSRWPSYVNFRTLSVDIHIA